MTKLNKLSDEDLIGLLQKGDVAAFEELYNRYWDKLINCAYKRVNGVEAAEEIVQDFFTSLWQNRLKLVIRTSFSRYVFSSVRYLVYSHYQKESSKRLYQESRQSAMVLEDNSTENTIAFRELSRVLEDGVEKLPSKCKAVYELSRKEYKNNKEIAHLLGISEKTVENHLTKALRHIRLNLRNAMFAIAAILGFFQP